MSEKEQEEAEFREEIQQIMVERFCVSPDEASERVTEYFAAVGFRWLWYHETPEYWADFIYFGGVHPADVERRTKVESGYWNDLSL